MNVAPTLIYFHRAVYMLIFMKPNFGVSIPEVTERELVFLFVLFAKGCQAFGKRPQALVDQPIDRVLLESTIW